MNCPHCKRNDMTSIFARITERIVEWICYRCEQTWNVEE